MKYPCVAVSPAAFVRQVAGSYLPNNYLYYVANHVPDRHKDTPERVDQVLSQKYSTDLSKSKRSELRGEGFASVRYLRYDRFWILVGTSDGKHPFFREHSYTNRFDLKPLNFHGYSIRMVDGKPRVTVEYSEYRTIKKTLLDCCTRGRYRNQRYMAATIRQVFAFEPYSGVLEQFARMMRQINRRRSSQGCEKIPVTMVTLRNRSLRGVRLINST